MTEIADRWMKQNIYPAGATSHTEQAHLPVPHWPETNKWPIQLRGIFKSCFQRIQI